jgi:hypothetical protein
MSELSVGQLKGLTVNSNTITIPAGHKLYAPGTVVQAATIRSDTRTSYSSSNSGNGTAITDLTLTITPKFSNSLLACQWMINGEAHQDNSIVIHRNGALVTTTGQTGYNSVGGNSRWSGYANAFYDQNEDSTPSNWFIQYFATAGSTSQTTFSPATRASGGTSYTFYLNRVVGSTGTDVYENMVSTGIIWEIAQ